MNDNFDFSLVGDQNRPFGGYISSRDPTSLSPRFLTRGSKNVYLRRSGTIANRPGLKRRGVADAGGKGTTSSDVWESSLGRTLPLRVVNSVVQVESDLVEPGTYRWYDVVTANRGRVVFDTWWDNTLKKDILILCDGTDTLTTWSGAIGLLSSTTANTIVLSEAAATQGFSASGTVLIDGTAYTYSGISGSTLTGVSPNPTGEADNSIVIEQTAQNADTPADGFLIDFIRVINNQLYAGSESSRLVYISQNDDYTDFTFSSPRAVGEGEILTLDETPRGIGERDGQAHIGTPLKWYRISFNQITVGSSLSEQTIVDPIPLSPRKGPLSHEFIGNSGNDLVYLSEDQQLHVFGAFRNFTQNQFPSLSERLKIELEQENFTGGHMQVSGDFIYLTAPNTGRVWLHETRIEPDVNANIRKRRIWHAPFVWNISRIEIIDGIEYGHANAQPQLYQLWDTLQWHDDSPSDEPIPYDSVARFAYWGNKSRLAIFDKVYYEGYMSPGSVVSGNLFLEYQGANTVLPLPINTALRLADFYEPDISASLGESTPGDNPLGDQTSDITRDQDLLPKFRVVTDVTHVDIFEFQVEVSSSELDSRWELLAYGPNMERSEDNPVNIRR